MEGAAWWPHARPASIQVFHPTTWKGCPSGRPQNLLFSATSPSFPFLPNCPKCCSLGLPAHLRCYRQLGNLTLAVPKVTGAADQKCICYSPFPSLCIFSPSPSAFVGTLQRNSPTPPQRGRAAHKLRSTARLIRLPAHSMHTLETPQGSPLKSRWCLMHPYVHCTVIYSSQALETAQAPISG